MLDTKIFDTFEHMGVYVVDKTSLTVYYENPIAGKYTGRCRIGEPCFQAHGNDCMCSTCPIRRKDHITLVNRSDYNMIFAVRCEEIVWDGHDAYMITLVKQGDSSTLDEDEKSMSRMSRALQKSVNVYTEINMDTMRYRQINFHDSEEYNVDGEGEYSPAFEYMCTEEIHPDDVPEIRRLLAPDVLRKLSYESEGIPEVSIRYRMKNTVPERIMESRAVFMRDEVPHYVVSLVKDVTQETMIHQRADELESTLSHVSCGVAVYNVGKDNHISVAYLNDGIDNEYRPLMSDAFQRIIAGEKSTDCTFRSTTRNGNKIWVNVNLYALQNKQGILQIYGTFIDVTSDVKAQQEFQERYEIEKRRRQDDASVLAYGVFDLQSGNAIEMERKKPLLPIVGKNTIDDFRADVCNVILLKEQKVRFEELFNANNLLKLHEQGNDEQSMEYQRKLLGGNVTWVQSSFRMIAGLTKNRILLFYYCNDIDIRRNIELMSAYMVDTDYDMIGDINLVDDDAVMLYGKNSSMRSAGCTELQSRTKYSESLEWFVQHAVVPEERQFYYTNAFVEQIKANLAEKSDYEFTLHVQDAKLGIRTKKIRYTRNNDDANSCFFSQMDITDTLAEEKEKRKQLQEALESAKHANEAKTLFLSRMSHDMRTPMNTIIGLTSLSLDEKGITSELKSNLDNIRGASEFLLGLVNDVLDMSKIDSGAIELKYEPYDYKEFLAKLKTMFEPQCKEKNIESEFENMTVSTVVMTDKLRMDQVFFNIFSNAIKFTPEGGKVSYHTENVV